MRPAAPLVALLPLLALVLPLAGCQGGLPRVDGPLAYVAPPNYSDSDFLAAPRPPRRAYAVDGLTGEELVRRSDLVMREAGEVRYTIQHERFSISPPPERVVDPDSGELIDPSEGVIATDVEGLRGTSAGWWPPSPTGIAAGCPCIATSHDTAGPHT